MDLLTGDDFAALFDNYREAFRAEFRHHYLVASDNTPDGVSDFDRWLSGAEAPDLERKGALLDALRAELSDGRRLYRVKAMNRVPSLYDLYSAEWGYAYNVEAGEEVYIIDEDTGLPAAAWGLPDFWLIDDRVVIMRYDTAGRFLGASIAPEPNRRMYLAARDALMAEAVDFRTWWAAHPELHRTTARAA